MIAIMRRLERDRLELVADAIVDAGIHVLEVTFDSDGAIEAVATLVKRYRTSDVIIGAGTILDLESAARSTRRRRMRARPRRCPVPRVSAHGPRDRAMGCRT